MTTKVPVELSSTPGIVDGSNATAITIDSSERVGIGTASPSRLLTLSGTASPYIALASNTTGGSPAIFFGDSEDDNEGRITYSNSQDYMSFSTATAERMRIDSNGNIAVGTSSPNAYSNVTTLTINGTNQGRVDCEYGGTLGLSLLAVSGETQIKASGSSNVMTFEVNNSERARIDTSGVLLIGKTANNNLGTVGFELFGVGASQQTRDDGFVAAFNRKTSDGNILEFYKDTSLVGKIGAVSGDMYLGTGDANLRFTDAGDGVKPATSAGADLDDHLDLGAASARFNNLLLVNQPTVGSDVNLKQDIEDLSEAEKKVAVKAKGLLKKYKYKNSVTDKGENARIHIGIIAQELQEAFTSEGLDAYRYSMFCSDTWTDETTGEEKTQLGIRYTELLAFIIAAI